jgi:hypothetical protein
MSFCGQVQERAAGAFREGRRTGAAAVTTGVINTALIQYPRFLTCARSCFVRRNKSKFFARIRTPKCHSPSSCTQDIDLTSCRSFLIVKARHSRHTSHVTRHTSHLTPHTSHVTRHTSHVTRRTSHVTRHTSHVTRHTSHVTRHTSHVTPHTSHAPAAPAAALSRA